MVFYQIRKTITKGHFILNRGKYNTSACEARMCKTDVCAYVTLIFASPSAKQENDKMFMKFDCSKYMIDGYVGVQYYLLRYSVVWK